MWSAADGRRRVASQSRPRQYEVNFRENKIDADVLPQLTADDLKDIGVSAVGDRRRLLDAIAALAERNSQGGFPPCTLSPLRRKSPQFWPSGARLRSCSAISSAQRALRRGSTRRIGATSSTPISTSHRGGDASRRPCAEEARRRADGPLRLSAGAGERRRTRGARRARHPARARRAQRQNAAQGAPELSARIGLDFGPGVVDATGEVFGDAPNVAARVQALAEPGAVARHRERAAPGRRAVCRRGHVARTSSRACRCR